MTFRDAAAITGYHAHIYFDPTTRARAVELREEIGRLFTVELGRVHDVPVGPHPISMYQVAFAIAELPQLLPWLMLNRSGLSILVHPMTGDEVEDHDVNPLWLGSPLPLNLEFLRQLPH